MMKINGGEVLFWYFTIMMLAKAKDDNTVHPFIEKCRKDLDNGTLDKAWGKMSKEEQKSAKKFVEKALPDLMVFLDYNKRGLDINDPADRCWYTHGAEPYDCYLCYHHGECSCGEDFWND